MAPHRNHVEARSSRRPARQFVSETHDHKADAPAPFFVGTFYSVKQIESDTGDLKIRCAALLSAHGSESAVGLKLAAEGIAKLAGQIQSLADHLAKVSIAHVNRRPRP